jgi:hypothetical protein
MAEAVGRFDPLGPVFISYRTSDGADAAARLAWALRATGVPAWHDQHDLLPGDIEGRLEEALQAGLSGAVILVTPDVDRSEVVRFVEVARLLDLARSDARFSLAIANAVLTHDAPGEPRLDHRAPDRLLGQRPGTLAGFKQYRYLEPAHADEIAAAMAMRRMTLIRESGASSLEIDIQTRETPGAWRSTAALVVRLPPPEDGRRVPAPAAWAVFAPFLGALPGLLAEAGVRDVRIRGGAHLSAAIALGAAIPVTSMWQVAVIAGDGRVWEEGSLGGPVDIGSEIDDIGRSGHLAAMVDCVPGEAHDTFGDLVDRLGGQVCAALRLRCCRDSMLDAIRGAATATALARLVRDEAARRRTTVVHLAIRAPFALALLLGRRLNTLELVLYEWEATADGPMYIPTLTVAPGRGSPVLHVHMR